MNTGMANFRESECASGCELSSELTLRSSYCWSSTLRSHSMAPITGTINGGPPCKLHLKLHRALPIYTSVSSAKDRPFCWRFTQEAAQLSWALVVAVVIVFAYASRQHSTRVSWFNGIHFSRQILFQASSIGLIWWMPPNADECRWMRLPKNTRIQCVYTLCFDLHNDRLFTLHAGVLCRLAPSWPFLSETERDKKVSCVFYNLQLICIHRNWISKWAITALCPKNTKRALFGSET